MWSKEAIRAFDEIKRRMVSTPIPKGPNSTKPFEVLCIASCKGINAVFL